MRALCQLDYAGRVDLTVVVDGSTDGTAAALSKIVCPFAFRIIEQVNGGAASARNRGAAEASGDIILFLDDDMISEPDLVEQHARMYRSGADAVIGDTPLDPCSPPGFLSDSIGLWIDSTRVATPLSPFDIFTGQLSVRRGVFEELGGFDAAFTCASAFANEDADFGVELLARFNVRHNPAAICRQRYVVGPRQSMERARSSVAGDFRFVRKHPRFTQELFEARGVSSTRTRFIYQPLSRIPLVPQLLGEIAVRLAEAGLKTRFRSSPVLRRFFGGARAVSYWSAVREHGGIPGSGSLLILCYHAIEDQSADPVLAPYGVSPDLFEAQLDSLSKRGFVFVGPDALAAFLVDGEPLPQRAVLLTFDDCYPDLLDIARDVLRPRGIGAIAFAVTAMASGTNEWDQPYGSARVQLLQADQLRELASLGVEIGSHSRTHREMPLLSDPERTSETAGSADDLMANGLPRPRFFAYPYGAVDRASINAVRDAGYLAGFGLAELPVRRTSDLFNLPRVIVLANDRGWRFRFKTAAPATFNRLARTPALARAALRKIGRLLNGDR